MAETAVSDAPEPSKPTDRMLDDMSNLLEFWQARLGDPGYYNGRLGAPEDRVSPFMFLPDPPSRPTVAEAKRWRARVRAGIVRREEIIKSLPAALKERARVKVYDYIFGWILEDSDRRQRHQGDRLADDANLFF